MAIIDDIKVRFASADMLMRIIYINIGVFVVLRLIGIAAFIFGFDLGSWLEWIEMPSDLAMLAMRPWTVITYSLAHYDALHILFNMLWLYWLGQIFLDYFTPKQLSGLYIIGALGGALLFAAAYNLIPNLAARHSHLLGASASVLAIVVAIAVYAPHYKINLLFIGELSLKWLVLATIFIYILTVDASNAGGHIAHLGGVLVGALYGTMMRRGKDITAPLNGLIDRIVSLFARKHPPGVGEPIVGGKFHESSAPSRPTEADLDRVLDKIKRSGYSALTDEERNLLFGFGKKK